MAEKRPRLQVDQHLGHGLFDMAAAVLQLLHAQLQLRHAAGQLAQHAVDDSAGLLDLALLQARKVLGALDHLLH